MKPSDKLKSWNKSDAYDRIESCRVMLHLHGFISEAENKSVKDRIYKWMKKHDFIPCLGRETRK